MDCLWHHHYGRLPYWDNGLYSPSCNRLCRFAVYRRLTDILPDPVVCRDLESISGNSMGCRNPRKICAVKGRKWGASPRTKAISLFCLCVIFSQHSRTHLHDYYCTLTFTRIFSDFAIKPGKKIMKKISETCTFFLGKCGNENMISCTYISPYHFGGIFDVLFCKTSLNPITLECTE